MRTFVCDSCSNTLFFENTTCLTCGSGVGFRADEMTMATAGAAARSGVVPCRNWSDFNACNWYATDAPRGAPRRAGYCLACAFNEVVPDLADPQRLALWTETERAKRRLIHTLLQMRLPLGAAGDKHGLTFRLLADERVDTGAVEPPQRDPVFTGHDSGQLTMNVVEADDTHREAMRKRLNEPYRTVLGHLRHEIGHYYWYRLVADTELTQPFRTVFGDERTDYARALAAHYSAGVTDAWQQSFVSHYASAHPWEDFAETWAHYIHIVDTLDTASDSALALGERRIVSPLPLAADRPLTAILGDWLPLAVCLNQLNRSMGMHDAYPFRLSDRVIEKLAFVHLLCLHPTLDNPLPRERQAREPVSAGATHWH
jgi:hypothetical protein